MSKCTTHWNLRRADNAAHKENNKFKRRYVSKVRDEPKRLAKSETWESVKRRRADGDPLMNGKHGREFERATHWIFRDGEMQEENIPMRNENGKRW